MAIVQTRDGGVLDEERCEKWLGSEYILHGALQVLPALASGAYLAHGFLLHVFGLKNRRNLPFDFPFLALHRQQP